MVLVACEESQAVTVEFRRLGIEAYSCDIRPCSGEHPEWHIRGDAIAQLKRPWQLIITFPPCTHLAISGAKWFPQKIADGRQPRAAQFFLKFVNAPCDRIAIENPVGVMSTLYRKPDQIVHPYHFGDAFKKRTCLWLKNLPLLIPTDVVDIGEQIVYSNGKRFPKWYANLTAKGRAEARSKTFPGIAKAMAEQWSKVL